MKTLGSLVAILLLAFPAAADGPAVSEPHALLGAGFGAAGDGTSNSQAITGGAGYFLPIGHSFGAGIALDVGVALSDGEVGEAVSGGAAFFWRDPEKAFISVRASGYHDGAVF